MGTGSEVVRSQVELSAPRIHVVLFGPEGRGGFNQCGLAGAEHARAQGNALQVHWCAPADAPGRADYLRSLCLAGADLLVAHGGQGDAPVSMVAHEFPHTQFAITQGNFLAPNVACYEVLQEQSAFLAGVLAASTTRSGVVAHMSGEQVRPGLKGRAAFADGVRHQNSAVQLVTLFCGNQHDPELAHRVVTAQANAGADVLFAMIDGGREGAIRACRERGMLQIGNVIDWTEVDPTVFIASAIADSGYCIGLAVADFVAHRLGVGHKRSIGLEDPRCVRLAMAPQVQDPVRHSVQTAHSLLLAGMLEAAAEYLGPEMVM
jgi:basic membrane protein A